MFSLGGDLLKNEFNTHLFLYVLKNQILMWFWFGKDGWKSRNIRGKSTKFPHISGNFQPCFLGGVVDSVFFLSKVMDVGWWGWYLCRRVTIIFWHGFHSNRKGRRGHVLAWASDRSLETAMLAINIFESASGVTLYMRKMNQKCRKMLPLRWAIFSKCSHDQRTFPLPSALKGCSNRNFPSYLFCPLKTARLKFLITTSTTISSIWNMLK